MNEVPRERVVIGVDLGGTKIEVASACVGAAAAPVVITRERTPTPRDEGYEAIVARVASFVGEVAHRAGTRLDDVDAVGVGMPGSITRAGLVKNANTVCLNGRPFRADLQRALGRAIAFDNDATLFALAETKLGAGAPYADGVVFGVILGTGVGGGLVVRGEVWSGAMGVGGEWGHHAVWAGRPDARPCYCGQRGCVEAYLSGPALEAQYRELGGPPRPLAEIVARRGADANADVVIESMLATFGRGLANVVDVLDPSVIVLGGGLSNLDVLYDEGRARVASMAFTDELVTPIRRHACGDSAGVLGAVLLAAASTD